MVRVIQFYPEWTPDRNRNVSGEKGGIKKFKPDPSFKIPYDNWNQILKADELRGCPDRDTSFLDDYDIVTTIILGDNIGSTYWLRQNYPEKVIFTILEPIPPEWYAKNFHNILTKPWGFPLMFKDVQSADIVFMDSIVYVEPLRRIFQSDKIFWLPNPVAIDYIKSFVDLSRRRRDLIGAGLHNNFPHTRHYTELIMQLLGRRDKVERWLFNSPRAEVREKQGWKPIYDRYIPFRRDHQEHLREQNMISIFVDDCTGACSIQTRRCAAMGIPTVGNNIIDSHVVCCPDLCSRHQDTNGFVKKLKKLLDDDKFYEEQVTKTLNNIQKYSFDSSRKRLKDVMVRIGLPDVL